jgi:hypothetical protein
LTSPYFIVAVPPLSGKERTGQETAPVAVPRPAGQTMWLQVNGARMILVIPALGAGNATAVTACSQPEAGFQRADIGGAIFRQQTCNPYYFSFL